MVLQAAATLSKFTLFVLPLWWGLFLITELQGLKSDDDVLMKMHGLPKDDVRLILPTAVEMGQDLLMDCQFNSNYFTSIYSVKWYKGQREFFRFTPKERPEKKTIKLDGITVDESRSDINRVYLRNVPLQLTGSISCELTPETNNFKEVKKTQNLTVIVQAENPPTLETSGSQGKYLQLGDTLQLTCNSGPSKPAANLTFYINSHRIQSDRSFRQYPPEPVDVPSDNKNYGMETRRAVINVTLNETLFIRYKIKIKCAAVIYDFAKYSREYVGEMPIPSRPAASGYGNRNSATSSLGGGGGGSGFFSGKLVWSITTIRVGTLVLLLFLLHFCQAAAAKMQQPLLLL